MKSNAFWLRNKKMDKTKIILKEHYCKKCDKNIIQEIKMPLGLNAKGSYTNDYCLNCDARLRDNDFKEIRTDFNCPNCDSFLNSGYVKVCGGCGGFLSWVKLDKNLFKLPKYEFNGELIKILESLTYVEEPKNKHELDIKEFKCPFCGHKETLKVHENVWNENTKNWEYMGIDYWECPKCGEENDIGLENYEKEFKIFKKYTEKNDWNGLRNLCMTKRFDDFMLSSLAKYYIQKQEFEKSLNIAKILFEIDTKDICSEELMEKSKKGMKFVNKNE